MVVLMFMGVDYVNYGDEKQLSWHNAARAASSEQQQQP